MEAKVTRYLGVFINLVFVLIAAINVVELVDIVVFKEFYPFGAEFFSSYSIYNSEKTYLAFKAGFTVLIVVMVTCFALKFGKAFWLLAFLNVCLALYMFLSI